MKHIKPLILENTKEQIPISELIDDLKTDENFAMVVEDDGAKHAMAMYLRDADAEGLGWPMPSGQKYKFVQAYSQKGDGYEEETIYGIFQRKSDGKHFKCWVHDAGFIGPETLTMCKHMEEVTGKTRKVTDWD